MINVRDRQAQIRQRPSRGTALSEAGPALFLLLIFAVFPALDLITLGISYYACSTLNDLQLREAAKAHRSEAQNPNGAVMLGIPNNWRASSLGGLSRVVDTPQTEISYNTAGTGIYVNIATTVQVQPLLTIPFFPKVPGLGAPVTFRISRSRVVESAQRFFN